MAGQVPHQPTPPENTAGEILPGNRTGRRPASLKFDAPEGLLTYEQQERVQQWVDDQPSYHALPNILTPRSPRPPPLNTQFIGLRHPPIWSRSRSLSDHTGSELDLESGGSGDGVLDVVEAYRDNPHDRLPAGRSLALGNRCGTHLGAAAGYPDRGWYAGKVAIYAAGSVVLYGAGALGVVFWAKTVWDYLTEYHS